MPHTADGKIHYDLIDIVAPWERGRETIIFHHGIGASAGIWVEWLPALATRYRIVCIDMRGSGRSYVPAADEKWSLEQFSADLVAVLDAIGAKTAHVVGESIGGTIALHCAIHHPNRVASLTISNGADMGGPLQRVHAWQRQIDEEGIHAWSEQFMRDRFYDDALTPSQWAWYARQQEAWSRDCILKALSVLTDTNLRPQLATVRCPVLLLHADASPFIPVNVMADMHRSFPDSRLQVFAHARHGLPFSHAGECARVLREFLDSSASQEPG